MRACENDPKQRYASADMLSCELALLHAGSSVRRKRKKERAIKLGGKLVLATALTLIVGAGLSFLLPAERTVDPRARELYDRVSALGVPNTKDIFTKSVELLNEAISADPDYAEAYELLALIYFNASEWHLPPREAMSEAKKAAEQALAIDESLVSARVRLGIVKLLYEWDWDGAERELLRALKLEPDSGGAHNAYAGYLRVVVRHSETASAPRSPGFGNHVGPGERSGHPRSLPALQRRRSPRPAHQPESSIR
jgi:tetratricopeptide (TPR) repeat protein